MCYFPSCCDLYSPLIHTIPTNTRTHHNNIKNNNNNIPKKGTNPFEFAHTILIYLVEVQCVLQINPCAMYVGRQWSTCNNKSTQSYSARTHTPTYYIPDKCTDNTNTEDATITIWQNSKGNSIKTHFRFREPEQPASCIWCATSECGNECSCNLDGNET